MTAAASRRLPRRGTAALALALLASACTTPNGLRPFTTDGCSLFPDRALVGNADWCECCVTHDLAYWRGGTENERRAADEAFRQCVVRVTGDPVLADSMFAGVRAGGTPYLPTSFRWAYGWPYERNYQALTPEERARAERLEAEFRAQAPPKLCAAPARPAAPAGVPAPPPRKR